MLPYDTTDLVEDLPELKQRIKVIERPELYPENILTPLFNTVASKIFYVMKKNPEECNITDFINIPQDYGEHKYLYHLVFQGKIVALKFEMTDLFDRYDDQCYGITSMSLSSTEQGFSLLCSIRKFIRSQSLDDLMQETRKNLPNEERIFKLKDARIEKFYKKEK